MFKHLKSRKPELIGKENLRKSSVLIPLIKKGSSYDLLFEVRSENINQPGDISFPGGRVEKDESREEAAIRETAEELEIDKSQIEIIAPMDYYLSHSALAIYPYLGHIYDYNGTYNKDEVASVFTAPLDYFIDYKPKVFMNHVEIKPEKNFPYHLINKGEAYPWFKGKNEVPFYKYEDKIIWGMPAVFLRNAVELIKNK